MSDNVQYLVSQLATDEDRIHRFQIKLDETTAPLDNAEPDNLRALKLLAEELIFENREELQSIADTLV